MAPDFLKYIYMQDLLFIDPQTVLFHMLIREHCLEFPSISGVLSSQFENYWYKAISSFFNHQISTVCIINENTGQEQHLATGNMLKCEKFIPC